MCNGFLYSVITNEKKNPELNEINFMFSAKKTAMADNIMNAEDILVENINNELSQNPVYCNSCENNFINKAEFDEHNHKKQCSKKFSCTKCSVSFKRRDHLKRHMLSLHSNVNYYSCPICSENCYRKDSLKKHIKINHLDRPKVFHCQECGVECTSLDKLEAHKSIHLLSDWHFCEHCKMPFKRRDHMLRHVKTQHSNECVQCPVCTQSFKRKDHLSRHIREKHKID